MMQNNRDEHYFAAGVKKFWKTFGVGRVGRVRKIIFGACILYNLIRRNVKKLPLFKKKSLLSWIFFKQAIVPSKCSLTYPKSISGILFL